MLTGKTNTFQSHPSLLVLQAALTAAESATPSRPQRVDVNEQRAAQLIQNMRAGYRKPAPLLGLQDIPNPDVRTVRLSAVELSHA